MMGWASFRHFEGLPNNLTQNHAFFEGAGPRLAACGNSVSAEALGSALDATIPRSEVNSCSKPMVLSVSPLRA